MTSFKSIFQNNWLLNLAIVGVWMCSPKNDTFKYYFFPAYSVTIKTMCYAFKSFLDKTSKNLKVNTRFDFYHPKKLEVGDIVSISLNLNCYICSHSQCTRKEQAEFFCLHPTLLPIRPGLRSLNTTSTVQKHWYEVGYSLWCMSLCVCLYVSRG